MYLFTFEIWEFHGVCSLPNSSEDTEIRYKLNDKLWDKNYRAENNNEFNQ